MKNSKTVDTLSTGHCINKVGLSNVCTHDQEGIEYPNPIFPFKLTFEPTVEVNYHTGAWSGTDTPAYCNKSEHDKF